MFKNFFLIIALIFSISKKNFFLLSIFIIFDLIIISFAVLTLIPLADFFLDQSLKNPSKITFFFVKIFDYFTISKTFYSFSFLFIFFLFLKGFSKTILNYYILQIKYSFLRQFHKRGLESILNTDLQVFSKNESGFILNTFLKEVNNIGTAVKDIATSFAGFFQLLILLFIPFIINFKISFIVSVFFLIFYFLITYFITPFSYRYGKKSVETSNEISGSINQIISYSKNIISFNKQIFFLNLFLNHFDKHIRPALKYLVLNNFIQTFFQPIAFLFIFIVIFFSLKEGYLLSELSAIFFSLANTINAFTSILGLQNNIINFFPSFTQYNKLISEANLMKINRGNKIFNTFQKNITFDNVNFFYNSSKQILSNINLNITKNSIIGIVGRSGSGKSTLINLILGLNKISSGQLLIDSENIYNYKISSLREKISYVSQEVYIFSTSIRNNILWFAQENQKNLLSEFDIIQALKESGIYEYINNLPKGLDTVLGDAGLELSGGQRQRLATARALVRSPDIIIFDEATSSLDPISEDEFSSMLKKFKQQKKYTIIIISHKPKVFDFLDQLVVMDDGKILEVDCPKKLMLNKNSALNKMYNFN